MSVVLFEIAAHVATVTINRPDKLNAINDDVLHELASVVERMAEDRSLRCAILTGAGEKAFVAGADIARMSTMSVAEAQTFATLGQSILARIEALPFPVIAAVNGFALGGGCEIALACDFIYASDKAKLGQPEVNLGVIPGFGGTQRLARRVGVGLARELCYTGDIVAAAEALRIGLVNKVVPAADLMTEARATAAKIAAKGPLAIGACKRVLLEGPEEALPAACAREATAFAQLFATADQREGMAAFVAKRTAEFRGA
ncbi:MAG: enoyl-CoA hydratase/isomerase family protein [Myxococcales bacterium]|nr:enoyl-CoA hydratase/isomerase family protein [Myxococcales bacterium]